MPEQWNWNSEERLRYLTENLAAQRLADERTIDAASQREHLSRLLQERFDELDSVREPYSKTIYPIQAEPNTEERNTMAFPAYNQNERELLDALNVTAVSLQYDTTVPLPANLNPRDPFDGYDSAPLSGVDITVAGPVTDKQAKLLTAWAQGRFGQLYKRGQRQPVPVAEPVQHEVPVTFTERHAK